MNEQAEYFNGRELIGDDFGPQQIAAWFEAESEGYAELGAADRSRYRYAYHALNKRLGFDFLPKRKYANVLGLGSAYGDEFRPILPAIEHLTISDPSASFKVKDIDGVPVDYVRPSVQGSLPFDAGAFDLVLCLGVLHHIPNVTAVLSELRRVLSATGYALIREPIVSMGDWRQPRRGLTKNERGIPRHLFADMIATAGFEIQRESLCIFPPLNKLAEKAGLTRYNSNWFVAIDHALCKLMSFNYRYHQTKVWHKFAPTSSYFVLSAAH